MVEQEEDAARAFAVELAEGAKDIVSDLKAQAARGFLLDPAKVNALRPS
jgi:hypothetical protein